MPVVDRGCAGASASVRSWRGRGLTCRRCHCQPRREFFRIGLSANTTGISVYVLGLDDKTYLSRTYGPSIGKASDTGYCIKFRRLAVINAEDATKGQVMVRRLGRVSTWAIWRGGTLRAT